MIIYGPIVPLQLNQDRLQTELAKGANPVRAKMAASARLHHTGRKRSPETRQRITAALLANHPMKGRKHSEATRKKMSEANRMIENTPEWRARMKAGRR